MNRVSYLLEVTANYVSFGLALYALGAVLTLIWLRKRNRAGTPDHSTAHIVRAGACVTALLLLEIIRQFCDFPLWAIRAVLPGLYFVLGNSVFHLMRADTVKRESLLTKDAGQTPS